jgi:multidrug/hemolysin transport system ATP-binding protein
MKEMIRIKNLKKRFGEIQAVNDLSFEVREGELFAFLGENGAGKSTTISIICSQLEKDEGEVWVDDQNIDEYTAESKSKMGVVFQNSVLDKPLSVYDNLKSRAALYGIFDERFEERLNELDGLFSLKEILHRPVGKLSGGQRRRADIARALLHKPKILILDEPTTGLDPQTRKSLWSVVEKLRKEEKTTVFLTTHYMEEAAEADYIVILDHGKIAAKGTPLQLKNSYAKDYITLYGVEEERVVQFNKPYEKVRDAFRISVDNTKEATDFILRYPDIFVDYEIVKGKMDDVFLSVTGKTLEEGKENE